MSSPVPESRSPHYEKPEPEDLSGIPVCFEEHNPTVVAQGRQGEQPVGRPEIEARGAFRRSRGNRPPTADDLAGIPVCAEGDEDLTVRPRKPKK